MRLAPLLFLLALAPQPKPSYTHALAGNAGDATAKGTGGGGDVVVIRASGGDAYNKWTLAGKNTAYFLGTTAAPESCEPGKPVTLRGVNVYRIDSTGTFDLPAWRGTGGLAYSLDAGNGVVTSSRGELY